MRLIDADALDARLDVLMTRCVCLCKRAAAEDYNFVRTVLETAPTVPAVEVVRCKDCEQWRRNAGFTDSPNGHCFYHDIETNGHDFCSDGERKDTAEREAADAGERCEYCRNATYTAEPFVVTTHMGKEIEVQFHFCPYCGARIDGGNEDG